MKPSCNLLVRSSPGLFGGTIRIVNTGTRDPGFEGSCNLYLLYCALLLYFSLLCSAIMYSALLYFALLCSDLLALLHSHLLCSALFFLFSLL